MKVDNFIKYIKKIIISNQKIDAQKIRFITSNSRLVQKNSLFVAIKGPLQDGHKYVNDAINNGAIYVLCDNDYKLDNNLIKGKIIKLKSCYKTSEIYFELLNQFNNLILNKFKFIGVTGTNGKTTISYILNNILKNDLNKSFIIGTTGCIYDRKKIELSNTTPGPDELFKIFNYALKNNYNTSVMEISSHALDQNRVSPEIFQGTIFTNLTLDHLDYHKDIENYFRAKLKLFQAKDKNKIASINIDDKYGKKIYNLCQYKKKVSYSIRNKNADFYCKDIQYSYENTLFKIICNSAKKILNIKTNLIGEHNVYNILGAVAVAYKLKIPIKKIEQSILNMSVIPGRLEKILLNDRLFMVDYAHTPDALINVLKILNVIKKNKVITIFGCGGDRDKTKRPKMFNAAITNSDIVIVTSDNPRTEKPENIIEDILSIEGDKYKDKYFIEIDRRKAIKKAYKLSDESDIILVAGKGHENYQIFGTKTIHFSDSEEIKKL